ncbi:MAG: hypothetical protein K9K37_10090 [Desulfocapsa sp.]|nr:hypothetical protein [Desulfocapsa sp.]
MKTVGRAGLKTGLLTPAEEAEVALRQCITIESGNVSYLQAIVQFYLTKGQVVKAREVGEQMLAEDPGNPLGRQLPDFIDSKKE